MLARASRTIPEGSMLFEPKWDGFRCLVFRDGDELVLQSRNERPLVRYFPELVEPLLEQLPERCVVDGELVVVAPHGLDFELLSQRIHPAERRIALLSGTVPASFVAFDLLALDDRDLREEPLESRRALLEQALGHARAPLHLTPVTTDHDTADEWFERFTGSGFDGVMAKPLDGTYVPDRRVQFKIKHHRSADCVVAGYRHHKDGGVGALLLGLFGDEDEPLLHHIGVCSAFSTSQRRTMLAELEAQQVQLADHPWAAWADAPTDSRAQQLPPAPSATASARSAEWVPLSCELVVEVTYENVSSGSLRHPARFVRWRPDRDPDSCHMDQLDSDTPPEFTDVFGTSDA
jgi:ATP-dependent DNA ligase